MAAAFTTKDGELIYLLAVTNVSEQEDGSLEVSSRGKTTHLTKKDAHEFKLATSSPYRTEQQPSDAATLLDLKLASLRSSRQEEEEQQQEKESQLASLGQQKKQKKWEQAKAELKL